MAVSRVEAELRDVLLEAAVLAPSMHNTQPWLFWFGDGRVDVYRDVARELPAEDPDGRAALLSLGAVVFNLQVAAAHDGWRARLDPLSANNEGLFSITLTLERETSPEVDVLTRLYPYIPLRRTNRMFYYAAVTTALLREDFRAAAVAEGAGLEWVEDRSRALWLLRLEADALAEDACDPRKVVERGHWVGGERLADGVPSSSLGPRLLEDAASSLAVLSTKTDDQADRLQAGMALQRVWLVATRRRLAVSLLTAAVAHRGLRWMICDPLSGRPEPHVVLRFGFGPFVRPTPRRPIAEFLLPEKEES